MTIEKPGHPYKDTAQYERAARLEHALHDRGILFLADVPPHGKMYNVVLPGAMMQWMWELPEKWLGAAQPVPKYTLFESFKINRDVEGISFFDRALELRHHERRAPPTPPGFWAKLHEKHRRPIEWMTGGAA